MSLRETPEMSLSPIPCNEHVENMSWVSQSPTVQYHIELPKSEIVWPPCGFNTSYCIHIETKTLEPYSVFFLSEGYEQSEEGQ